MQLHNGLIRKDNLLEYCHNIMYFVYEAIAILFTNSDKLINF